MSLRQKRYREERFDLRKALVVAVLLHVLLGGLLQWRPAMLFSAPLPPEQAEPLRFRLVDTPDLPEPETPPDTEVLSDRDRRAADASPREDADAPFSEGNTSQQVLRQPPSPPPVPPPSPRESAAVAESARPETEEAEERPTRPEEATGAASEPAATPEESEPGEARPATPTLPPEQPRLRDSLAGPQSFIDPEVYDNPEGGAGPQGLVSFDTKGFDLGPYIRQILTIIERNWKSNIPPAARLPGMRGATFVRLSIERVQSPGGREGARIVVHRTWASGTASFDQAALFALEISDPLPPIPSYFPYDRLDGRLGFLYNLDPEQVTFPAE